MSVRMYVRLQEVDVQALDAARLESLVGAERMARFEGLLTFPWVIHRGSGGALPAGVDGSGRDVL